MDEKDVKEIESLRENKKTYIEVKFSKNQIKSDLQINIIIRIKRKIKF